MEKKARKAIYLPKKEVIRKMVAKATDERKEQFYIINEDKHLVTDLEQLNNMCNKLKQNPRVMGSVSYSNSFGCAMSFFSYQQQ